jgi:hypothetical protein
MILSAEVTGFEPVAPTLRTYPTMFGSPWCIRVSRPQHRWLGWSPCLSLHHALMTFGVRVRIAMAKPWPHMPPTPVVDRDSRTMDVPNPGSCAPPLVASEIWVVDTDIRRWRVADLCADAPNSCRAWTFGEELAEGPARYSYDSTAAPKRSVWMIRPAVTEGSLTK